MAFPTSGLTNNQVHKEGNRAFVYDSTLGVWDQVRETDDHVDGLTSAVDVASGGMTARKKFSPGEVVCVKTVPLGVFGGSTAVAGTSYIATSSTSWVGMGHVLNITHSMADANNQLVFMITTGNCYVNSSANEYYVGVGKTTDLTGAPANIIRYGNDDSEGRFFRINQTQHSGTMMDGRTSFFQYDPGTTAVITYQPLHKTGSAATGYWTNNSGLVNMLWTLTEIQGQDITI